MSGNPPANVMNTCTQSLSSASCLDDVAQTDVDSSEEIYTDYTKLRGSIPSKKEEKKRGAIWPSHLLPFDANEHQISDFKNMKDSFNLTEMTKTGNKFQGTLYACNKCEKSYKTPATLKGHYALHFGLVELFPFPRFRPLHIFCDMEFEC